MANNIVILAIRKRILVSPVMCRNACSQAVEVLQRKSDVARRKRMSGDLTENKLDWSKKATWERMGLNVADQKLIAQLLKPGMELEEKNVYLNCHWDDIHMSGQNVLFRWQESEMYGKPSIHSHTFYEIVLVWSGNIQYLIGNKRIQVKRGDVILIPPGISHQPLLLENQETSYERGIIWLNADFWKEKTKEHRELDYCFAQCEKRNEYIFCIPAVHSAKLFELTEILREEVEEGRYGWEITMENYVMQLMITLNRILFYQGVETPTAEKEGLLDQIRAYIEENLEGKMSLEIMARAMHVSPSTVSHTFQRMAGMSFYQYVVQRRLIEAQKLVLADVPMKEIWQRCGFPDYTAFFRAFKKEYGVSPRQYREEFLKK